MASGGLLWLSFFPVAWGWLAWVALVPLLTLVRSQARPRAIYLSAWAGGLVFFLPALQWMRVADYRMYFTWVGLAVYCALFFPLAIYLMRFLVRRVGLSFLISVPVVWTAVEFLRSYLGGGFSWYLLAHTQHDFLNIIQIADVTGALGVTFLLALVNAFLCAALSGWRDRSRWRKLIVSGAVVAVVFALIWSYGVLRRDQTDLRPGPVVALIQGNLPQYLRNNPTTVESIAEHYVALNKVAARSKPDLIVWPESSMPFIWEEEWPGGLTSDTKMLCRDVAHLSRAPVLLGINSRIRGADEVDRRYNSAALVAANGEALARYDKIHRVPFGEYVPLREWLPFMNWLAPYDFDYSVSAGSGATRFPSLNFGVVICYEDTDSAVTLQFAGADGHKPTDFLLNISNDGWFEGTSEHEQHLAICRFRAIECRQPVARAVNMGISALIASDGTVLAPTIAGSAEIPSGVGPERTQATIWKVGPESQPLPKSEWKKFATVSGVILATMPLESRSSIYARFGDWLPWACWLVLGASGIVAVRRRPATTNLREPSDDA
jgi:apolipoprotein N-acyltransferase